MVFCRVRCAKILSSVIQTSYAHRIFTPVPGLKLHETNKPHASARGPCGWMSEVCVQLLGLGLAFRLSKGLDHEKMLHLVAAMPRCVFECRGFGGTHFYKLITQGSNVPLSGKP